jgi:HEPN domain-containing protein
MLDYEEHDRLIRASGDTLRSVRGDLDREDYNQSCFKA